MDIYRSDLLEVRLSGGDLIITPVTGLDLGLGSAALMLPVQRFVGADVAEDEQGVFLSFRLHGLSARRIGPLSLDEALALQARLRPWVQGAGRPATPENHRPRPLVHTTLAGLGEDVPLLLLYDRLEIIGIYDWVTRLLSPERIVQMSSGRVREPGTYASDGRPKHEGLFCLKIFGPRGDRWGHIDLPFPVFHPGVVRSNARAVPVLLAMRPADVEYVVYAERAVVVEPGAAPVQAGAILSAEQVERTRADYEGLEVAWGAEPLVRALAQVDLKEAAACDDEVRRFTAQAFLQADARPEWMAMTRLPVLPPSLRTDALTRRYADIVSSTRRIAFNLAPVVMRAEIRRLQQQIDDLFSEVCDHLETLA